LGLPHSPAFWPFLPVPIAAVVGTQRGELQAPLRRLAAEAVHRSEGAELRGYGDMLRPAVYGPAQDAMARECTAARQRCAILDASSLGKIEVLGPDAAALLDFVFYTRMSSLAPGRLRYGLALAESGAVFDDGVVLRVSADRFVVSCSSSHVAAMTAHLEAWRAALSATGRPADALEVAFADAFFRPVGADGSPADDDDRGLEVLAGAVGAWVSRAVSRGARRGR
jgi:hypothetical protein